jgi:hypothetical protein
MKAFSLLCGIPRSVSQSHIIFKDCVCLESANTQTFVTNHDIMTNRKTDVPEETPQSSEQGPPAAQDSPAAPGSPAAQDSPAALDSPAAPGSPAAPRLPAALQTTPEPTQRGDPYVQLQEQDASDKLYREGSRARRAAERSEEVRSGTTPRCLFPAGGAAGDVSTVSGPPNPSTAPSGPSREEDPPVNDVDGGDSEPSNSGDNGQRNSPPRGSSEERDEKRPRR